VLGLITVVLAVTGPIDAVVSRSIDTTPERADDLLERVVAALDAEGIPVRRPPGSPALACAARRACVRDTGVTLGSRAVVAVDIGHVTGQMAVNVEAVSVPDGQRLAQLSFSILSAGYPAGVQAELEKFARALKKALGPEDAPVVAKLEPVAAPPPVQVVAPREATSSAPVGPLIVAGLAVAAAVASVSLGVSANGKASELERAKTTYLGMPSSNLSRAQAEQLAASANGQYAGSAVGAGAAVALGAGALVWWFNAK